jgi:hypothetical protein
MNKRAASIRLAERTLSDLPARCRKPIATPPLFDCRPNTRRNFAPGFYPDQGNADYDKKNIVIGAGPDKE